MKIKELKALIGRAGLEHADCLDKDALLERAQTAVARLSACKTAQDEARGALVPINPPSVVEPTEEIEYSLEERADRLLVECGLERGETVEDDVRAAAAALSIEFEDTQTTLARLEATAFGGAAASPPPQSPPRALVAAPPRALAIANDVYSRNDALALAEDDGVEDMSARELKTLVVHGGDARALVGVVEKSELRQLAAAAQLALRGDKAAESSDDDFEMGETLSEEERARRAKAKAEREGNVQDISDDDSDVEDLTQPKKKRRKKAGAGAPAITKQKPSAAAVAAHLSTLRTDSDRILQRVLLHAGASFLMKTHQPEAVRLVAGLPRKWPRHDCNGNLDQVLATAPPFDGRGLLLADVMGLGKTVECLLGALLRKAVARARGDAGADLPTVIVAPNDAVLTQWREHLLQGIVDGPKDVHVYGRGAFAKRIKEHAKHVVPQGPASYVLMTKYTLQTEFASAYDAQLDGSGRKSPLFPAAMSLLPDLHAQWRSASGRLRRGEKNSRVRKGETEADAVRRLVGSFFFGPAGASAPGSALVPSASAMDVDAKPDVKPAGAASALRRAPAALTVVIDEAHQLRNPASKWGLAAALLGHSALRCVCATGTPYNNGTQDMATLVSFWDARQDAAAKTWWLEALKNPEETSAAKRAAVQAACMAWRQRSFLRRDKSVLTQQLPPRNVESEDTPLSFAAKELHCYVPLQAAFLELLAKFARVPDGEKRERVQLFKLLLSVMTLMRMCSVHPVLCRNGRELTTLLSPTRRKMKKLAAWKPDECVYCKQSLIEAADDAERRGLLALGSKARLGARAEALGSGASATETIDLDGKETADDADDDEKAFATPARASGVPPNEPLVNCKCHFLPNSGHKIHKCCLAKLGPNARCPRCVDLERRAQLGSGKLYCRDVLGGFRASTKLEACVREVRGAVKKGDACLVLSFAKGPLDLTEAMLEHYGVSSIRFDGDIKADARTAALKSFQNGGADVLRWRRAARASTLRGRTASSS